LGAQTAVQPELTRTKKIGASITTAMSGNGHGATYIPQLVFTNNRNAFMLGASLQKQAMQFNGMRLAYSFVLSGRTRREINADDEDSAEVYQYFGGAEANAPVDLNQEARVNFKAYAYAEYLKDNLLSRCTQQMEEHVNRIEGENWKTATLSTIEAGLGVQMGVRLTKNLYWNSFVAASFYYHTKYIQNMHHERFSPCITIGTSINIPDIHF
jgi:hypothetical protein